MEVFNSSPLTSSAQVSITDPSSFIHEQWAYFVRVNCILTVDVNSSVWGDSVSAGFLRMNNKWIVLKLTIRWEWIQWKSTYINNKTESNSLNL